VEKAQNKISDLSSKDHAQEFKSQKSSKKSSKGGSRKTLDMMFSEDSIFANSETYAYSATTNKRSASKLDTLSYFETSPMLKRVKTSDEEEKHLPLYNDQFSLGDSVMTKRDSKGMLRKSKRKRVISKAMLEAIGEDTETVCTQTKSKITVKLNSKYTQDITRIHKLDQKWATNEHIVPFSDANKYLVAFKHKHKSKYNDIV
jgi:hypothetical protein